MLCRPERVRELFRALHDFKSQTKLSNIKAIGAKIRLGMTEKQHKRDKVYLPVAELAGQYLDYLTVHPRHAGLRVCDQEPDLDALREIKSSAPPNLVVIGNADVTSRASFEHMTKATGCDAVMVARGAIHNPWMFRHLLDPGKHTEWPSLPEVDKAEAASIEWERRWAEANGGHIKNKYVTFRQVNFQRIRHFVKTGEMLVTGNKWAREMKDEHLRKHKGRRVKGS